MNQEEKDRAVLAAMVKGFRLGAGEDHDAPAGVRPAGDGVEAGLRAMGLNRREREQLRRRRPGPPPEEKYRSVTRKRFRFYIAESVPGRTEADIAELVAAWVNLTNCDLDRARRWWDGGVDPNKPGQLAAAVRDGLQIDDLDRVVQGKTIAEHLQAGSSLAWCMGALHWQGAA